MQRLGKNVTHGYRVAATGEMELNGTVSPIGGVKQKTYGVRASGADVFLVPASEASIEADDSDTGCAVCRTRRRVGAQ